MNNFEKAKQDEERLIELRRHFHRHPELTGEEVETSRRIMEELDKLNIEYKEMGRHSVVGMIYGGKPGKTVALRADMDALPVEEQTGLPYRSEVPGVMHACGHDIHVTALLGAAKILQESREELKGNVKLIFQEAEERLAGAELLCAEGVMDGVDAIFGMHVWPELPAGVINIDYGYRTTAVCSLHIKLKGKAGHSSIQESGTDAMMCGAEILQSLQTVVKRKFPANEYLIVHIGKFNSGLAENIIADECSLDGGIRFYNMEFAEKMPAVVERTVRGIAQAHDCEVPLMECISCMNAVDNDKELTDCAIRASKNVLGEDSVILGKPMGGSEDFAVYLEHAPGAFVLLGASLPEGTEESLHSAFLVFDEKAICCGAALHAEFVKNYLNGE